MGSAPPSLFTTPTRGTGSSGSNRLSVGSSFTLPHRRSGAVSSEVEAAAAASAATYVKYCDKAIRSLTDLLDRPRCTCKAELLHLRGLFRAWSGDVIKGLDDFAMIWKVDAGAFPTHVVRGIVEAQPREVQEEVIHKSARWRDILAALTPDDGAALSPTKMLASDLDSEAVRLPEIGGESEVRTQHSSPLFALASRCFLVQPSPHLNLLSRACTQKVM